MIILILILILSAVTMIGYGYYKTIFLPMEADYKRRQEEMEYRHSEENESLYRAIEDVMSKTTFTEDKECVLDAMVRNKGNEKRDRFSQKYIDEHYDIDSEGVAYIFYHETKNEELRVYLKMKWAFK